MVPFETAGGGRQEQRRRNVVAEAVDEAHTAGRLRRGVVLTDTATS